MRPSDLTTTELRCLRRDVLINRPANVSGFPSLPPRPKRAPPMRTRPTARRATAPEKAIGPVVWTPRLYGLLANLTLRTYLYFPTVRNILYLAFSLSHAPMGGYFGSGVGYLHFVSSTVVRWM